MSGSTIGTDWRFIASILLSPGYLMAAARSTAEALFVGWGLAYFGDVFYPDAGAIIGIVPSLAVTIIGLNATALAKPVLSRAGVDVVEDLGRWSRFSVPKLTVYNITMLWGICAAIFWQYGQSPFILLAFLFAGLAYVYGYALGRIPSFTVAYLMDATAEQERAAAGRLYSDTVAIAVPGVALAAYLLATSGPSDTYMQGFLTWQTLIITLIPLIYFPYYVAVCHDLLASATAQCEIDRPES